MGIEKTVEIALILLIKDPKMSVLCGPALCAAFDEVQRFFVPEDDALELPLLPGAPAARVRPSFTTHLVSSEVSPAVKIGAVIDDPELIGSALTRAGADKGIVDHVVLGGLVHQLVEPDGTSVIVTDVEIRPPPDWRYMIWDSFPSGAVVSFAPLDPMYWYATGTDESERVATIKTRARAACLTVVGSLLGVGRCANELCFMLANVDSVLRLDEMVYLGGEHGIPELEGRSFAGDSGHPAQPEGVMTIVTPA